MNFIQYIKQAWKAGTSGGTPLSPDRLNHIEDGIKNNNDMISELNSNMTINLLNPTLQTTRRNGITCTNNADGTYTIDGTATNLAGFELNIINFGKLKENVKLCGCPSVGSDTTYKLSLIIPETSAQQNDYGNGVIINNPSILTSNAVSLRIVVYKGTTLENAIFKPMLTTNLNATYNDFVSYTGNTGRLNADVALLKSNLNRRTRTNITNNLSNLSKAVAEQNLEKYGYSIGDYFTGASGYEYTLADMDTYYGGYNNNAVVSKHHVGILINTKQQSKYQESGNVTSYASSTLHSFLTTTVLDKVKSDFTALFGNWNNHLLAHNLLNNAIGGWGTPTWIENNYIEALTEVQTYGSRVFGADGYQTGAACKKLTVFDKFRYNQILGNIQPWLRSLISASVACHADANGVASNDSVNNSGWVAALILFY